jgi:hypothetical protein
MCVRIVVTVTKANDALDSPIAGEPARWSVAGTFLEALSLRDYERLAAALHEGVRVRALLPPGSSEWEGRDEAAAVFRSWFGAAERFELVDATVGDVMGRLQMTWRIRLRPAPFDIGDGWHVIEQHAFADVAETIEALDLVCSGFRAEPYGA